MSVCRVLVSVSLAALAAAADAPAPGEAREFTPGKGMGLGQGRTVVIRGKLDLDVVNQGGYTAGNREVSDHNGGGIGRAELGAKIKPDETSAVVVGVAWQGDLGQTPDNGTNKGYAVVNEAYADLRDVLGFESFGIKGGRMPVTWNLRPGHGAWLLDSTANHPTITSWDGGQMSFTGLEDFQINPLVYAMPDAGTLFGAEANWEPAFAGSNRVFITGMATWENKTPREQVDPLTSGDSILRYTKLRPFDDVNTYSLGVTATLGQFELFAEGATQRGKQDDWVDLGGRAMYAGVEWKIASPRITLGAQVVHQSGQDDYSAYNTNNGAFIAPWEGTRDLYIMEDEKYGELTRTLQGTQAYGQRALKLNAGWVLDERNRFALDGAYGFYRTAVTVTNLPRGVTATQDFGQEFDLTFSYNYNFNTTLRLLGGIFLPKEGYTATAPNAFAGDDYLYLMAGNVRVTF
jgi:hypothetical protein